MWKFIGASAIFATIIGYLLVNIAIISIGVAIINYGLMNVVAGIISLVSFQREIKASPNWPVTALGACGIIVLVLGLQSSQNSLRDPATTVEVVYDVLVLSSVGLWVIAEKRFGLPNMPVWWPDIVVHIYMALLVASRLFLHWRQEWTLLSFVPIGVTTLGYWGLNISIRLSGEKSQSHRATSVAMNILAGLVLVGYALIVGGETQSFPSIELPVTEQEQKLFRWCLLRLLFDCCSLTDRSHFCYTIQDSESSRINNVASTRTEEESFPCSRTRPPRSSTQSRQRT